MKLLNIDTPLPLFYMGKDEQAGEKPALLYLALSAKESLTVTPFDRPVLQLQDKEMRIFSVDLPFHGEGFDSKMALTHWAQALARGEDIVNGFLFKLQETLERLFSSGLVSNGKLGVMGLSRGGFIAWHIASRMPQIEALTAFAPLTSLLDGKDFEFLSLSPLIANLNLEHQIDTLCTKRQRIYIGNRDVRVGTDACYRWVRALTEAAFEKRMRSPHVELMIKPSIGHQGHGTSQESFDEGALWLFKQIAS